MWKILAVSACLASGVLMGRPALAFEQTAPAPAPHSAAPVLPPASQGLAGDSRLLPGDKKNHKNGTLKIPGLGSINLLPKMDFGLELLYGEPPQQDIEESLREDDVTIRGTVKRRF